MTNKCNTLKIIDEFAHQILGTKADLSVKNYGNFRKNFRNSAERFPLFHEGDR